MKNNPIPAQQEVKRIATLSYSTISIAKLVRATERAIKSIRLLFSNHTFPGLLAKIELVREPIFQ
jgi:hypothetical protein